MGGAKSVPQIQYSVQVEKPSGISSGVYRHPSAVNGFSYSPSPEYSTVYEGYMLAVRRCGNRPFMGTRVINSDGSAGEFVWKTYNEIDEISRRFAASIRPICPRRPLGGWTFAGCGVWSRNREELYVLDIACERQDITIVPLYDTLGEESVVFSLDQTCVETVAISAEQVKTLIPILDKMTYVKNVIYFDDKAPEELVKGLAAKNMNLLYYKDMIKAEPIADNPPTLDSILAFSYTSGTTGVPKGVLLMQKTLMAELAALNGLGIVVKPSDSVLSYLPYPHLFERMVWSLVKTSGSSCGFFQGDPTKIADDAKTLRPTLFPSVPRLFNRVYSGIQLKLGDLTGIKRLLAKRAVSVKLHNLKTKGLLKHALYDRLVFNKMREALGGRVRFMLTGSAPIKAEVIDFLKIALQAPLCEVYGQTENMGGATMTWINDTTTGHVGGPIPSVEFKVEGCPDIGYTANDVVAGFHVPRGEVCLRGPVIMPEYFLLSDKTAEAIDSEGWLHTGDVGAIQPNGTLKIVDRKKNIFKLNNGEYLAPERLENIYSNSPQIAQIFVHGDSDQAHAVAIVVPDQEVLAKKYPGKDFYDLCEQQDLKEDILNEMDAQATESQLKGFERIRVLHVHNELFSIDNNLLTPTQKLARHIARKQFAGVIEELYKQPVPTRR